MANTIKILDLFSGIGGFTYAAECIVGGFKTAAFCESDSACRKVLKKHWPHVPVFDDVRSLSKNDIDFWPDVITAGFPCQDLSSAGKQAGYDGKRSILFYEIIRLARELRPNFILLENVRNLLSHKNGETFQETLFQIAKAGYDAEWAVVPASDLGACHRRERIWIVAYSNNSGLQGFRPECELQESSKQKQISWGNCNEMLSPKWGGYLSKPVLCRGDDGLSGRVDRLKQLGNSVVPQVAAIPLKRIKTLYYELEQNHG